MSIPYESVGDPLHLDKNGADIPEKMALSTREIHSLAVLIQASDAGDPFALHRLLHSIDPHVLRIQV